MRVCVSCEKEIPSGGTPIREDRIIAIIRSIKRKLNIARNNELVVCDACKPKQVAKRAAYERTLPLWIGVAALCFLGLAGLPLLTGQVSIPAIFLGLALGSLLLVFAVFLRYVPAVTGE